MEVLIMAQKSTSNSPNHAGVWVPPPVLYILPLLLAWLLQNVIPLPLLPTGIAQVTAALLFVVGTILAAWSIGLFRRSKTSLVPVKPTATLVMSGPYQVTRNPMYLSLLCLYLAAACWFNMIWALLLAPIVVGVVQRIVIEKEERYLEQRFGETYRQYKARVRRWI
jgi:protein-S-isoprenylcysteine O-methyltransferase Ste14